jgi:RNA recognition motif-containing protein
MEITNLRGEKLFVGNLPCNANETEIWSLFAPFGIIIEIICLGPNRSRSGQACAFVKFAHTESALSAIENLDGKVSLRPEEFPELMIQVRPAKSAGASNDSSNTAPSQQAGYPGCVRLFLGNLPIEISTDEIHSVFRTVGLVPIEEGTFIMSGRSHFNNAVCAFVLVESDETARLAIKLIDGKFILGHGRHRIRVRVAHPLNGAQGSKQENRGRSFSDSFVPVYRPNMHPASMYGPGLCLPVGINNLMNWDEPSIKTYHQYMLMPQSQSYGPMNIVPGNEPWRNNGIYSLPTAPYTGQ